MDSGYSYISEDSGLGPGLTVVGAQIDRGGRNYSQNRANNHRGEKIDLYSQLWHVCAGPLANVPSAGDKVYYFPQGHIEQVVAYMSQDGNTQMPVYDVPYKILCKVVNTDLKAEAKTDEVFAQITLLPQVEEPTSDGADSLSRPCGSPARFFIKRLTPSDRSTHGGFSIPKKDADNCFPPLDMSLQVPSQELVAKDLHGKEWQFHHTYRGQPKRHLITTGWTKFLAEKNITTGDTCIFASGENGGLYVGIRRASRPQYNASVTILSSLSMQHGILASAYHAFSNGSMFTVYYRPWSGSADFIIPYDRYKKSAKINYSIGTKFRMASESEEPFENKSRMYAGTVVGMEDMDSVRWHHSEWRCLKVRWDALRSGTHALPERVSHWNIEPIGITKRPRTILPHSHPKRTRPSESSTPQIPFVAKEGVLQGQEDRALSVSKQGSSDQNVSCKFMLFGADLSESCSKIPSPHTVVSSGVSSLSGDPLVLSQPRFPETINISENQKQNEWSIANRTCTKVLNYGTAVGRAVDLARFCGYKELISELDKMFDFEGALADGNNEWNIIYTDSEGDTMLLGDYPYLEFRGMVHKIFICPKEKVHKVNTGSSK